MDSKTILITGSTDGIGKVTAKALAKQGHHIIIHGRNKEKAITVSNEIKSETGNSKVDFILADLLSLADIKRMATEFKSKYEKLDVLINNAGAVSGKERLISKDGIERTMALNVFAPLLLSELLIEVLAKSSEARIVNLSSAAHAMGGKPDLNDIQLEKSYGNSKAYGLSKLYVIWFTQHLATELKKKGINNITVNSLHPGTVKTDFGQSIDKGFFGNLLFKTFVPLFGVSIEKGAETSVYLASSPDVKNITGKYFSNKKVTKPSEKYYSKENEQRVWDYCEQIIKPYL